MIADKTVARVHSIALPKSTKSAKSPNLFF